MCNSYILNPGSDFYQRFHTLNRLPSFPKNTDIFPGDIVPIINRQEGLTLLWIMKWGLIPFWAKERGVGAKMFNLRAESVISKLGFKKAFKTQRCLIPSNGFYISSNYFDIDHRPLISYAGIYDIWVEPVSGREVYTFAIITTVSNSIVKPFSDIMPVILRQSDEQIWLDPKTPTLKLESILRTSPENLNCHSLPKD